MLSNGGTFVEIGDIVRGREVSIDPSKLLTGKNIVGSLMYRPSLLPTLLDFLVRTQHKLPFHKIISHKFPLSEVNEAFPQSGMERSPDRYHSGHAGPLSQSIVRISNISAEFAEMVRRAHHERKRVAHPERERTLTLSLSKGHSSTGSRMSSQQPLR